MAIKKRFTAQTVVLTTEEMRARVDRLADVREQSVSAITRRALDIGLKVMEEEEKGHAHAA